MNLLMYTYSICNTSLLAYCGIMNTELNREDRNGDYALQSKWMGGLCNCGADATTCCITCFFPCITFGQIAETVDEGRTSCFAHSIVYGLLMTVQCHWLYSCLYRNKLRKKFSLAEEPCCDCLVNYCCEPCALCQEHAELKARGFNPSIGWIGPPTSPPPHMPPTMFK